MRSWNSDDHFGFAGAAAGGSTATAATPVAPASSTLRPHPNALGALTDPRGSAIFWIVLAAGLGLAMVTGQLKVSAALKTRAGK